MDPLSFLKTLLALEPVQINETGMIKLQQGQIIRGKILRIFQNQTAEIQIGSQNLTARAEIPLLPNQEYWFQVQSEEGQIRLKLLKGYSAVSSSMTDNSKESQGNPSVQNPTASNGSIEQIMTQVPIQFGQYHSELTIQWNGKRKENGKIDSDSCRILFFIELKIIGEIFVDLQVINRKMSIRIINQTPNLKEILTKPIIILKENLHSMNFQLTSLKIEKPPDEKPLKLMLKKAPSSFTEANYYSGVDVRI